jgi:hypothetical protein
MACDVRCRLKDRPPTSSRGCGRWVVLYHFCCIANPDPRLRGVIFSAGRCDGVFAGRLLVDASR